MLQVLLKINLIFLIKTIIPLFFAKSNVLNKTSLKRSQEVTEYCQIGSETIKKQKECVKRKGTPDICFINEVRHDK